MPIKAAQWGRDHQSLMLYLETVCVDHDGWLLHHTYAKEKLRCDPERHPLQAYRGVVPSGTRLFNGSVVEDHDDWDCLDDLIAAGYVENVGTGIDPRIKFSKRGWSYAHRLRREKAKRGLKRVPT